MQSLLIGAFASFLFSLLFTPLFIRLFKRLNWGQFVRDDGPVSHHVKRGTATMGGIVIIIATISGYSVGTLLGGWSVSASALSVLGLMTLLGGVGFVDDYMKVHRQRSLGLTGWQKLISQLVIAAAFGALTLSISRNSPRVDGGPGTTLTSPSISIFRDQWLGLSSLNLLTTFGPVLGVVAFLIWICLLVTATANSVNLTDGLDGLAAGSGALAIGSYVVVGFWQFNQSCYNLQLSTNINLCYDAHDPMSLAIVAACITGSLIGFLWWNTSPARLFMGDTGSLAIGGGLVALAVLSRTELLLVLIGGLFVLEAGSVIIQRLFFKVSGGKRIFLMSPIHHHFELKGWAEVSVVVRFWVIGGVLSVSGVGLFYLEWLTRVKPPS